MKFEKRCVICGFDKKVSKHHIIKLIEGGDNSEENLVYLCPNHHWIADFGNKEERKEIFSQIKLITGKEGKKISNREEDYLNKKIRNLLAYNFGEYLLKDDLEWFNIMKTSNYFQLRTWLLGREIPIEISRKLNQKGEMLILINKLKRDLPLV